MCLVVKEYMFNRNIFTKIILIAITLLFSFNYALAENEQLLNPDEARQAVEDARAGLDQVIPISNVVNVVYGNVVWIALLVVVVYTIFRIGKAIVGNDGFGGLVPDLAWKWGLFLVLFVVIQLINYIYGITGTIVGQ